jgi:predicted transcriptional regulator
LSRKKYVVRNRDVWPHLFETTVCREELIGRRLQTTADDLCNGSLQPLLTALVQSSRLSAKDRKSLRGLLDKLEGKKS